MLGYSVRRVLQMIPVLIGATFIIYALTFLMPGDPVAALTGERPLPESTVAQIRRAYHLDDPFLVQYGHYIFGLFRGDFGIDFFGRPVLGLILERLPTTFALALTAWVLKLFIGLVIGVYGGLRHGRAGDHFALVFTVVFMGIPGFVIALGAQTYFGVHLGWVDPAGTRAGWPIAFILPALVMAIEAAAGLARLTRTSLVDVLRAEYLRTARAKGLSPQRVVWGHALRNAMIPVVTYLGLSLAGMLGGAVIIEAIFNIPGIGGLLVSSINNKEGTVVVGIATMLVLVYLVFNLLVDLTYGIIDPRVRL
ncbi:ABC transporter permease [Zhihengliuella halotolerans]|uniref:Peptide/nickel transport system permease protein/oligopeptide transport system permease protein n=1 Tax=Zhihengliuella halotolerans TaxID=370736 RepID=A0A4V2G9Y3_9MICC|nr:ABC transporter permease [Zhihengliuella halotolerans]RZU61996.1 peptide/nickel transport system permease protein/oligopeptide transport system permease protein [Zhihengliuella halotolerans]